MSDGDDTELRAIWAALPESDRQAWLAAGRALRAQPTQPVQVPLMRLMGIRLLRVDTAAGELDAEVDVETYLFNPGGVLHGAVAFSLADFGSGALVTLMQPPGGGTTTIELSIRYFKAVTTGRLHAQTRVISAGRRIVHTQTAISDAVTGEQVALGTASFYLLAPRS